MKFAAYIGTYGGGIYAFDYDTATGGLMRCRLAAELENPSWLLLSPDGRFLYSTIETGTYMGEPGGGVCAFAADKATGELKKLNAQPTRGVDPCHLCFDASGAFLLAANYTSGSVSVFPLMTDGAVGPLSQLIQHRGTGPVADRQEGPHAHFVTRAPGTELLCAVDLGADSVFVYRLDPEKGALLPQENLTVKLKPGSGPRHMAFHPSGFAYVLTEISWQIAAFRYTSEPFGFELIQTVPTLPDDFRETNYSAAIRVSPDGCTLYASNRGHDSISVFRIDPATGKLEFVQRAPSLGGWPRDFTFDPTGRFLLAADQNSDNIVTFEIEPGTGRLAPNGAIVQVPKPVCIQFMELE